VVRVVLPFLAGYYLSYVFRAVNAVLGPGLAAEFNLNAAQLGLLTGIYFFSFGLVQVPLGVGRIEEVELSDQGRGNMIWQGGQLRDGLSGVAHDVSSRLPF